MYEKHFGLSERPFNLTPDPRYLFLSKRHQEAFAHLQFGVQDKGGFVLLTGEVGTGKTTLLRHFLSQLGPKIKTAVVLYPALSAGDLFHTILEDLGVPFGGGTLRQAVAALNTFLLEAHAKGDFVVVVIDEAQTLGVRVLEQLRLLSNLETERDKLLTIVLVGQPELRDLLARPELRQLRQRINVTAHLEPLGPQDVSDYIQHRLRIGGGSGNEIDLGARERISKETAGVPRLVNLVADRALLGAFGRAATTVTPDLVQEAALEVLPAKKSTALPGAQWLSLLRLGVPIFALAFIALMAWNRRPQTAETGRAQTPSPIVAETPIPVSQASGVLRCKDAGASRIAAVAAVEKYWESPGFEVISSQKSLLTLKALSLPAVARMRGDSGVCFVALLPSADDGFGVIDDTGRYSITMMNAEARYDDRFDVTLIDRAHALMIPQSDSRARLAWAREALRVRKLVPRGASDAAVQAALDTLNRGLGRQESPATLDPLLIAAVIGPKTVAR